MSAEVRGSRLRVVPIEWSAGPAIGPYSRRVRIPDEGATRIVVALVLCALGIAVWPSVAAGASARAGVEADPPPDVIVVMTDDQRVGTERAMANVSAFFSRGGVRYPNAQVPTNLCCPARAAFLSGQYAHTTGVWENSGPYGGYQAFAPLEGSTLPVALSDAGYTTALFGKYLNRFNGSTEPDFVPPGWDAFHVPEEESRDGGYDVPIRGLPFGYTTDALGLGAADFIRLSDPNEPLFVMYAPFAPHAPYDAGPYTGSLTESQLAAHRFFGRFRNPAFDERNVADKPAWVRSAKRMNPRAVSGMVESQAESLLGVDANFARILASQAAYRDLDNTLVVYLSDNGYSWGEHRLLLKRHPYDLANRIPLWVKYPAGTAVARGVNPALVNNLDVTATILDVADADLPTKGISLLSGVHRRSLLLEAAPSLAGLQKAPGFCGLRTPRFLFVHYTTGETEFYDYRKDPWELTNIAGEPSERSVVRRFRAALPATGCDLQFIRTMPGAALDGNGD